MKQHLKPASLPYLIAGAGILGALLRVWLLTGGTDEKGLLKAGHPSQILLWILTATAILLLIWLTRDLVKAPKYSFNYPASLYGAVGAWIGAAGILLNTVEEMNRGGDLLLAINTVLGIASAAAIVYIGLCRRKGQPVSVLFHCLVCVYMMVHLVCLYRQWSSDPQLQDYCFQLLCVVCLVLSLFQRASFDAAMGNRRLLVLYHLGAVYFGLLAIPGSGSPFFYLGTGIWMLTDLCSLKPLVRVRRPQPPEA